MPRRPRAPRGETPQHTYRLDDLDYTKASIASELNDETLAEVIRRYLHEYVEVTEHSTGRDIDEMARQEIALRPETPPPPVLPTPPRKKKGH